MTDSILFALENGVAEVTLNRPDRLNALAPEMFDALSTLIDRAVAENARCMLLTGAGRGFSSGFDLRDMDPEAFRKDVGVMLTTRFNPAFEKLYNLPFPLITAINGPAAGAGCSLALYGDVIVAARSAYFFQSFSQIGLVPDLGSTWLLPRLIGLQRANRMLLLGERVNAEQAEQWGMIHSCVDDALLMDKARELAARLATGATTSYRLIRQGVRRALGGSFAESLAMEAENQSAAAQTGDYLEGVSAFRERRAPNFTGR